MNITELTDELLENEIDFEEYSSSELKDLEESVDEEIEDFIRKNFTLFLGKVFLAFNSEENTGTEDSVEDDMHVLRIEDDTDLDDIEDIYDDSELSRMVDEQNEKEDI